MKENKDVGMFGCLAIFIMVLLTLSVIAGAFGFGFATGGGGIENDFFSPDSEATCEGSNCTIVAVSGRSNHVSVAVDQQDASPEEGQGRGVGYSLVMIIFIIVTASIGVAWWVFRP